MLTVGLVVMVIFLFLRNLAATIIPSVAVPLSLVGTFGVMYLLGYSLNNLSLMALTISTGFVVDDAIVMIENIIRYIEEGDTPLEAALKGSEQIGFTIVSLSVSLIAALIPLLFMGDIVGRLFREFAVTLSVTIVVSARRLADADADDVLAAAAAPPAAEQGRLFRASERAFNGIIALYGRTLRVRAAASAGDAAGGGRHAGADRAAVHGHPQGLLPRAGHGRDPGHFRRRRRICRSPPWPSASRRWPRSSCRTRRGKPVVVHRHRRHQHDAQQRPHPDQPQGMAAHGPVAVAPLGGSGRPDWSLYAGTRQTGPAT